MLRKIRKYYYDNKEIILKTIFIVGFILLIIQIANKAAGNNIKKQQNTSKEEVYANINNKYNEIDVVDNTELATGKEYDMQNNKDFSVINKFFKYISTNKYTQAYSLLTTDCKEEMFKTEKIFKDVYVNKIKEKGESVVFEVQRWLGNTYKVSISEDILATGNIGSLEIEDYITIKDDKININNFIGSEKISGEVNVGKLNIKAIKKKMYKGYTVITFSLKNNSESKFFLDELYEYDSMYVVDKNKYKHISYSNELNNSDVLIYPSEEKELDIKYYVEHDSNIEIDKIVFNKVIEKYKNPKFEADETENVEIYIKKVNE